MKKEESFDSIEKHIFSTIVAIVSLTFFWGSIGLTDVRASVISLEYS